MLTKTTEKITRRVLIGKVGLDGHDRGAKYIAHILRDAGYEVIYTGIRCTPEEIVQSAIQEDVKLIGLSFLSGSHLDMSRRVLSLLKENDASDIIVFCGGVIPETDILILKKMGIREVFTPGTSDACILEKVKALF